VDKPRRGKTDRDRGSSEYEERVVEISRVSRVVKGGRRIRFRVLVVIGDQKGKIGYGIAKGNEIAVAVKKAVTSAKKRMILVPVIDGTIPYEITQDLGSARVFLKPASQGTSVVAGGVVRVIAELAGIKNLLSKTIGTANKVNNVKAVFKALSSFDADKVEIIQKRSEKNAPKAAPVAPVVSAVEPLQEIKAEPQEISADAVVEEKVVSKPPKAKKVKIDKKEVVQLEGSPLGQIDDTSTTQISDTDKPQIDAIKSVKKSV